MINFLFGGITLLGLVIGAIIGGLADRFIVSMFWKPKQ